MLRQSYFQLLKSRPINSEKFTRIRKQHQQAIAERPEPKYPPIIDTSPEGFARHQRQLWYDSVKALPTVEQKQYEITCQRKYTEQTHLVSSCSPTYLGIPFQRYITRTHLIQGLPESVNLRNVDEELGTIKQELSFLVASYLTNVYQKSTVNSFTDLVQDKEFSPKLVVALLSKICQNFADRYPHLLGLAFDRKPYIRSYWSHGGFGSEKSRLKHRNMFFQFNDEASYSIRADKPLPLVVTPDDPLCTTPEVVDYNYHPNVFGIPHSKYYLTSLPGSWPVDERDFPVLQFHSSERVMQLAAKLDHFDLKNIEDGYGVMASFGWLNGLATYQGFTTYHDLTYPIVGQTILTDGQEWTFFVYQLNTMCFHTDLDTKDKRNLCWTSGKMKLFDTIENRELKGVNEDVFKLLLKFVLAKPEDRENVCLKPYLGTDTRTPEEREEMRAATIKLYRNIKDMHNRLGLEVPLWQHVYKWHKDAPPSPWIKLQ